jgi:hypothetical protein
VESFQGFSLMAAMATQKVGAAATHAAQHAHTLQPPPPPPPLQHLSSEDQKELWSTFTDTFPIRFQHIYVVHQPW